MRPSAAAFRWTWLPSSAARREAEKPNCGTKLQSWRSPTVFFADLINTRKPTAVCECANSARHGRPGRIGGVHRHEQRIFATSFERCEFLCVPHKEHLNSHSFLSLWHRSTNRNRKRLCGSSGSYSSITENLTIVRYIICSTDADEWILSRADSRQRSLHLREHACRIAGRRVPSEIHHLGSRHRWSSAQRSPHRDRFGIGCVPHAAGRQPYEHRSSAHPLRHDVGFGVASTSDWMRCCVHQWVNDSTGRPKYRIDSGACIGRNAFASIGPTVGTRTRCCRRRNEAAAALYGARAEELELSEIEGSVQGEFQQKTVLSDTF